MLNVKVTRVNSINGVIHLPGDKSISHRAAIIASNAVGTSRLNNFSTSQDCQSTLDCLVSLGVKILVREKSVTVGGVGKFGFTKSDWPLNCGNSGTTMRLMAGVLAGQPFDTVLTGDDSLLRRPMRRIIDPLERMGAVFGSDDGRAPLTIRGGQRLTGISYEVPVASAQVKSGILLAGMHAEGDTVVIESTPTRDHTERLLRCFGIGVDTDGLDQRSIRVSGTANAKATDFEIPGDISSAAYFLVAASCLRGSKLKLCNVGLNPTRSAILKVLHSLGARISLIDVSSEIDEPSGHIEIWGGLEVQSRLLSIEGNEIAGLIDELPILAILGTQLEYGLEVRGAAELRFKESDRLYAITENLRRMGASVSEFDDGFHVERSDLQGAIIDSFGDHRIVMAFAVAGLLADGETEIIGAECANVSFPGFFETLKTVATR
jgi:3-phosphoshikimate 1-carboxyvinyltransferase